MNSVSPLRRLLRGVVHSLALRGPRAEDPTARVLHALLLALLVWTIFDYSIYLPWAPHSVVNTTYGGLQVLVLSISLWLLNRGSLQVASLLYLGAFWLLWTSVVLLNGGIRSQSLVLYVAIPISAAWLLGLRAALIAGLICLASSLTMAVLDAHGGPFPMYFPARPFGSWFTLTLAMLIASVPTAQVLRVLKGALTRSQEAEAALRKHQEHLEELVATHRRACGS